jgi:hypothetical protein
MIAATTRVDAHGMMHTKESLESMVRQCNQGESAIRMGIEHDMSVPPLGKCVDAELVEIDGGHAVVLDQRQWNVRAKVRLPDGSVAVVESLSDDARPLKANDRGSDEHDFTVAFDPVNLGGFEDFTQIHCPQFIQMGIHPEQFFRKSTIPDPEIVITAIKSVVAYLGLRTLGKAIGKEIAEKVSRDVGVWYDKIKLMAAHYVSQMKPSNKPITYILVVPGEPKLEIVVQGPSLEKLAEVMSLEYLEKVASLADHVNLSIPLVSIQYLDRGDGPKLNYMLTRDGKVISEEGAIARRNARVMAMNAIPRGNAACKKRRTQRAV